MVDVTINNDMAERNTQLLKAYASCPYAKCLGLMVKEFVKSHDLVDPRDGLLSSYAYNNTHAYNDVEELNKML